MRVRGPAPPGPGRHPLSPQQQKQDAAHQAALRPSVSYQRAGGRGCCTAPSTPRRRPWEAGGQRRGAACRWPAPGSSPVRERHLKNQPAKCSVLLGLGYRSTHRRGNKSAEGQTQPGCL